MKQKIDENSGKAFYLLLGLQGYNAPLQIILCAKFGACAIGWPSLL